MWKGGEGGCWKGGEEGGLPRQVTSGKLGRNLTRGVKRRA